MRKSRIFFYWAICFIIGVGIESLWSWDIFYFFITAAVGVVGAVFFWSHKKKRYLCLGALFLFLGVWRVSLSWPTMNNKNLIFYNGQQVSLLGKIIAEPDISNKNIKLKVRAESLYLSGGLKDVKGKVLVNTAKYDQEWQYGEQILLRCLIDKPGIILAKNDGERDFNYGRYLAGENIYSVCYKPEQLIKMTDVDSHFGLVDKINLNLLKFKQRLAEVIDNNMSLPESGLLKAMILGYRREISAEISLAFTKTGLTHIVAISGLNITLIGSLLFALLATVGISRQKSFWLGVLVLSFYVLMIGAFASAVRALVVTVIFMYGLKIGRLPKVANGLLLAALILLLINPQALIYDIGFQLSFLAILGLMIFYEKVFAWLKFVPEKMSIRMMVAMTLSAQVFTLPVIFYYFGNISFIAPVANLFVLPVLPILTVAGFLMIFGGLIWQPIAWALGLILHFVVGYIIFAVELLSKIPVAGIGV